MLLIYTTLPSMDIARNIALALITERAVACANMIPFVHTLYEWNGQIQQGQEVILLLKTSATKESEVYSRIRALHPYECPALFSLTPTRVNALFETWIEETCECRPSLSC